MSKLVDIRDRDAATNCKEGNYLISAGAGSGKTYTLANRIISLMGEKNPDGTYKRHFSELLVMTFTKKAAAEMKDRTRSLLRKKEELKDILPDVESASIVTFDAFALEVVKKFHYELGLGKDVTNLDEAVLSIKKKELLEEILMEKYESVKKGGDSRFASLIKRHEIKDDDDIANIVLKLLDQADLAKDKDAYFLSLPLKEFSPELIDSAIAEFFAYAREEIRSIYARLKADAELLESCPKAGEENLAKFEAFLEAPDYDALYSLIVSTKLSQFRGIEDDELKNRKDALLKPYNKGIKADIQKQGDAASIRKRILRTKDDVLEIVDLAKTLSERIDNFKREKNAWSFADIAKLAAKAVAIPSVKKELQSRYHYIMIDEYQDTSDLQEEFINSLGCPNVFQVGDMKQSIYGFRNANPSLFLSKYDAYRSGKGGTLYQLKANFRTRGPMLDSINDLFGEIMSKEVGGVDYLKNDHALSQGYEGYVEGGVDHHAVLVTYDPVHREDMGKMEASLIAEDIQRKMAEKYQIYDKSKKCYRDSEYKDFAVLVDKRSELSAYKRVFADYNIPFEASEKGERSEAEITIALKNLCRFAVIFGLEGGKKEKEQKHLYVSLMRSFLFQKADKEIFEDVYGPENDGWRKSDFYQYFASNRDRLLSSNLEDALGALIRDFEIVEKLPLLGEVKANYELLDSFEHLAASMSKLGYGLKEFSSYFEQLEKYEESFNVAPTPSGSDVVRYLTIHQSKGLEYPIIYLPSLFHSFETHMDRKANNSAYKVSQTYGLIIPSILKGDEDELERMDLTQSTLYAFLEKKHTKYDGLSEKMRLFYVALTRAKEKAYLFEVDKGDKVRVSNPKDAKNFSDFLDCYSNSKGMMKLERRSLSGHKGTKKAGSATFSPLVFKEISIKGNEKTSSRASKAMVGTPNEAALVYGERLHRLLELSDFVVKDTSWIADSSDRAKIDKVLAMPLFEKADEADIYHEYAFYDEEADLHGVIDLLLVYKDRIDLVDFKASSIDDPAYVEQLASYERYLSKVFDLPIERYLLSIQNAAIRKV